MRVARCCRMLDSLAAPRPVSTIAGNVPMPKAAIVAAPPNGFALVAAIISTLYTSPQGNQPQTRPSANAFGRLVTGTSFLAAGAIRVSLGWNSTEHDIARFADVWTKIAGRHQARDAA